MKYLVLILILHFTFSINGELQKEKKRSFSIFSLVQFQNSVCYLPVTSSSTTATRGTCFTSSECSNNGGTGSGSCASGFGVCCIFTVYTCGSTVSKNLTYIQNPGFPSAFTTATTACTYTISSNSDICQIRLDFDLLVLGVPVSGTCPTGDRISFSSPSGVGNGSPPVQCGTLTGSHMYIETARQSPTGATFTIANTGVAGSTPARTWKIRMTQIECGNPTRAPTDCLQYYTGTSGTFTSFNYQGGTTAGSLVTSQNYNICFRQEEGYCSIQYYANDVTAPAVAFQVDTAASSIASANAGTAISCANAELMIPTNFVSVPTTVIATAATATISITAPVVSRSPADSFCGAFLNELGGQVKQGTITSSITPFVVGVYTISTTSTSLGIGFNINYNQVPC